MAVNYIDVKNFRKYEQLFGDNGPAKVGHINYVIRGLNEAISQVFTTGVSSILAGPGISINQSTGNVTISNTITNNNQLINGANYISSINSSMITNALGYTPYNSTNPNGYISGITSGMVTIALGYTPYNSSNPSNYISGITGGMVTTALGYTPVTNGRSLTINGTTYDLSADRTWTIPTGVSQIVAGTNVTISPAGGTGVVTINAVGGPAPTIVGNTQYVYTEAELVSAVAAHTTGTINYICVMENVGLTASLNLPKTTTSQAKQLHINLMGNTIYDATPTGLSYLIGRIPVDQNEALNVMQSWAFIIENGSLRGTSSTGTGCLLDLGATYNSVSRNLRLENAVKGIHYRFCLMGRIEHITTLNIGQESIYLDKGNWSGATNSNSQSNHTKVESCRVYNIGSNFAAYRIQASSGVEIANSISEGNSPQWHVYFNSENSPVVKDFKIKVLHVESASTSGGIYVRTSGGLAEIDMVFSQYVNNLFVAESSGGAVSMIIRNVPWLPVGTKFQGIGNTKWTFTDVYDGGNLFNAATYWVSSTLPNAGQSVYWNGNVRATVNV